MPEPGVDVLVVGAGPVGLTAAWALARRGLRCRIVDEAAAPSTTSKALVLRSPLSSGQGAGARFRVVPLRLGDGTTIVGLLRSGAFQLLAFGGATPPSDLGDLVETQVIGENAAHGVTEPTLVLVRPDGYVAWRGPAGSVDELRAHLRRFLR